MKFNYFSLMVVLFFSFFLTGCVSQFNKIKPNNSNQRAYNTNYQITVYNNSGSNINVIDKKIIIGKWHKEPAPEIKSNESDLFMPVWFANAGAEGYVEYSIYKGSFKIHWKYTKSGNRHNWVEVNDPHGLYNISCHNCNRSNLFSVYVTQVKEIESYNILIMSDPQAWRLQNGLNPNKDRKEWEEVNQKVSDSINILNDLHKLKFGIVNGDITEFGRQKTWASFDKIYTNNIKFPLYIGLGNHDYANNFNDCWGNNCARNSFLELIRRINVNYKYTLENFNFDYDEKKRIGSGAYSWDMGDIHYVQLNNYPTYFENLGSVKVTKSTEWLDKDLSEAYRRGKATILNFHDSYDHIAEKKYTSDKEKEKLEKMIKDYNVIAIFSGHSHFSGFTVGYLRGVINYDSGALFKGDYLLVSVVDKCIEVEVYNGFSGQPVRVKRLGKECGD